MAILEIHLAPDLYLLTIDCFCRLYWNTVVCVDAKKCGLVGWKATQCMIPFVVEKGFYDEALLMEWIKTCEVDWMLCCIVARKSPLGCHDSLLTMFLCVIETTIWLSDWKDQST